MLGSRPMFRKNFPNLCLVSFKLLLHLLLLEWEIVRSPVYSSWLCSFFSESETAWSYQQAQRRLHGHWTYLMDDGCCSVVLSIHCRGMSQEVLPAENVCCPLFTLTRRGVQECWSSTVIAQVSVHHLSFSFQVQCVPPYGASCSLILRHLSLA